ncbi:Anoctamin-7 [Liparis tanakae]|uniref:Anoctamin n=1 Tax=Liparis tanakae TaxID=230148 RepID=A0A4Z2EL54_9TELE|nr:Anoctamin-7 [Liparis tanakae]
MSLWAVTFLEYWKRTCLFLSHRWDCSEFQDIERTRTELKLVQDHQAWPGGVCPPDRSLVLEVTPGPPQERPRPEFAAMAPMTTRSPVTGAEEPYFPENKRFNRTVTGCMVVILMVAVVLVFLMAVILYRSIITVCIYRAGGFLTGWVRRLPRKLPNSVWSSQRRCKSSHCGMKKMKMI